MITAIHINSTKPFRIKNKKDKYDIDGFEILTTILSALMWQKKNGNIKLYTDKLGLEYYTSLGILDLWNAGIDSDVVENIPHTINQEIFWAAAKIFALRHHDSPVAMIDTDLIVWNNMTKILKDKQISVLHREYLNEAYLPENVLKTRAGYKFDPDWDWTVLPCNTAFLYLSNQDFKDYYTNCAIDFMTNNKEYPMEMVSQMVFAEQRTLAMCAKKKNIPIHHFLDDPFQTDNKSFTHIWGAKNIARSYPGQRKLLCESLLLKIKESFPSYYTKLHKQGLTEIIFTDKTLS